ncbi:tyrosine-type recombinase/integrase [Streptococcus suis]|uniref:tyrosine-type recombinase/integrase n=1 Tax=Streptococcus suis TaxID=1307 RepID=UPI00040D18B4|nr:site-specific integrase [Streptococcus suis]
MFFKELNSGKYRYYEKYYDDVEGQWKQVSVTMSSKSRVMQAEAKRLLAMKIEERLNVTSFVQKEYTVNEVKEDFLKIRQLEVKESTYTQQEFILKQFFRQFGKEKIDKISKIHLQRYLLSFEWSNSYRRLVKTIISLFFDYSVKTGYLEENPMSQVVLPKNRKDIETLKAKQEKYLDREQMAVFIEYLTQHGEHIVFNLLVEFMYLTGLRLGEALALQWEEVYFEESVLEIKYTLRIRKGGEHYLSSPKTVQSYRNVSYPSRVDEILRFLYLQKNNGFVFLFRDKPIRQRTFNEYVQRYFKKAGVEKSENFKLTSHVLRHSHISLLAELNIPLKVIMDRVGHADEKTTLGIYTHVTEKMQNDVREKLDMFYVPKTNQESDKG